MKPVRIIQFKTTIGDLIASLSEEIEYLRGLKQSEKRLIVAYLLNDLVGRSVRARQHRAAGKV
ncbi:MAG TPA: hypothetical protein VMT22_08565 [Terriglobales bacterium]|nr:hypothetical protein [Terriglobales bacterium]